MQIKQEATGACSTVYKVTTDEGIVYHLKLWIISGGTPALNFTDHKARTRRYPCVPPWDTAPFNRNLMCYSFQDPDNLQGPTLDVLPNGKATVREYLEQAIPQREERLEQLAREAERERLAAKVGEPAHKWVERVPEDDLRDVPNSLCRPDGKFACQGRDLIAALRGAKGHKKGAVKIGDVIVGVTGLRKYARVLYNNDLVLDVQDDQIEVTKYEPGWHKPLGKSTILHGAWDHYQGENGHTCELVFGRP